MVAYAKTMCPNIEFSAEDASRSDRDYLVQVFDAAQQAGAGVDVYKRQSCTRRTWVLTTEQKRSCWI